MTMRSWTQEKKSNPGLKKRGTCIKMRFSGGEKISDTFSGAVHMFVTAVEEQTESQIFCCDSPFVKKRLRFFCLKYQKCRLFKNAYLTLLSAGVKIMAY